MESDRPGSIRKIQPTRPFRQALIHCALMAGWLLAPTASGQAIPDLTKSQTSGVNESQFFYLGPTGMKGWMYWSSLTTEARQILVTEVRAGTPSAGVMQYRDVILGIDGNLFNHDARASFVEAIRAAEADGNGGELNLTVFRPSLNTTNTYTLTLQELGTLSDTTPYNCPKVDNMLTNFCEYVYAHGPVGSPSELVSLWAMLASGEPKYVNWATTWIKSQTFANKTDRSVYRDTNLRVWQTGYELVTLTQLYLLTSDATLLPAIGDLANFLAQGQDWKGLWGHTMAWPQTNGGKLHGTLPGYGALNSAGLVALYGMVLAQKCGISDPEVDAAVQKSAGFFRAHVGIGAINYGYHPPVEYVVDSNGKMGMAAHIFRALGDAEAAKWFTMMTSIYGYRDWGHTGNEFNHCWGPLAAEVGGPALAHFVHTSPDLLDSFYQISLTMRRQPEGTFKSQGQEGRGDGRSSSGIGGGHATGGYGVQLAANRRHIEITGAGYNTNLYWLTEAEMEQVEFGQAYEPGDVSVAALGTPVLVTNLWHFAPRIANKCADELNKRIAGDGALLATLVATVENDGVHAPARVAALRALGTSYRNAVKSTVDTWYAPARGPVLNWGAAMYAPKDTATWVIILQAITEFDPADSFASLTVKTYAQSIYSMNVNLLDDAGKKIYYDAVEFMLRPGAGHGWFVDGQNIDSWDPVLLARYADSILRVAEMYAMDYDAPGILKSRQIGEGLHSAMVRSTEYSPHTPSVETSNMDNYGQNWAWYTNYTHAVKTFRINSGDYEGERAITTFTAKTTKPALVWFRNLISTYVDNTLTNPATKLADMRATMTINPDDDLLHAVLLDKIVAHPDNADPFPEILSTVGSTTPMVASNWRLHMGAVELGVADANPVSRWLTALADADTAGDYRRIAGILHVLAGKEAVEALPAATGYLRHIDDTVALGALDVMARVGTTNELISVYGNFLTNSVLPEVDGAPVIKNDFWQYAHWDAITGIVERYYAGSLTFAGQMASMFNTFTSNGASVSKIPYRALPRTPPFSILNPTPSQREVLGFGNGIYGVLGLFARDNTACRDALVSVHTKQTDPFYNREHDFTACEALLRGYTILEIVAIENGGGTTLWNERGAMYYLLDRVLNEQVAVTNLLQVFEVRNGKFLNASDAYYYQDAWQKELNYRRGIEETEGVHFFYLK